MAELIAWIEAMPYYVFARALALCVIAVVTVVVGIQILAWLIVSVEQRRREKWERQTRRRRKS